VSSQQPEQRRGGFVRDNAISLFFGAIFLLALLGQAFAGWQQYNNEQVADGLSTISLWSFLGSATFGVDVVENWQSEYLQFLLYIWATVWLIQHGSPESKTPGEEGTETVKQQKIGSAALVGSPKWAKAGGWRLTVFSNSLVLVMGGIFLLCWLAQSITGVAAYNEQQIVQLQDPIGWSSYVVSAEFWNRTLQNWQSEFLAVGSMAILAVFLRQRGSAESKPVGEPHQSTGATA
jgi:hypothetical protein